MVRALGLVMLVGVVFIDRPADGSTRSRARTQDAYALAYDLQFTECYEVLAEADAADPRDPAPRRAMAAVTWMEILFTQGVATFEAFTGEISKGDVSRPAPAPALTARFSRAIGEARSLAEQQLAEAGGADAHYQVGATAALSAIYRATVEGRSVGAFSEGRRAVRAMERARELDPGRRETALILEMSQYTVSTMSWPVRALARLSGLAGDREAALVLLREAALPGAETETDGLLLLMLVDARERRYADAVQRLAGLERMHPRNRLLRLNHGAAALAAGRPLEADSVLSQGIADRERSSSPVVLGELALWFAHRGTARARLGWMAEAGADLQLGLASEPRDWVSGRLHAQRGELAASAGDRLLARREFETAIEFSQRGGDRTAVADVKRKLRALER